jgi:hypothetical protein
MERESSPHRTSVERRDTNDSDILVFSEKKGRGTNVGPFNGRAAKVSKKGLLTVYIGIEKTCPKKIHWKH